MIRYALKCPGGHAFESWFQSSSAFEKLVAEGMIACPECGRAEGIEKALMAPRVSPAKNRAAPVRDEDAGKQEAASALTSPEARARRKAIAALQARIEANADYVGMKFASEARAIHEGLAPDRPIYGETRPEEAKALIEEGVPVTPLPFIPKRKTN